MSVYLIEDGNGVTLFDAGVKAMAGSLEPAGGLFGGIKRVVLGHAHVDHRGAARLIRAPVWCHSDEKADAESPGAGRHYWDYSKLPFTPSRLVLPRLLDSYDAGPVQVEQMLEEGDEVAGFQVVHAPGHAPGQIVLWRSGDRLALTSDLFYTFDPQTGIKGAPRAPLSAFSQDDDLARASMRKVADLRPAQAWPGHADPIVGDVAEKLRRAADQ